MFLKSNRVSCRSIPRVVAGVLVSGLLTAGAVVPAHAGAFLETKASLGGPSILPQDVGTGSASISDAGSGWSGNASATASYRTNGALAFSTSNPSVKAPFAAAESLWHDEMTISGGTGTVDREFTIHLSGTLLKGGNDFTIVNFHFSWDPEDNTGPGETECSFSSRGPGTINEIIVCMVETEYNTLTELEGYLEVQAGADDGGLARGDFSATAELVNVQFFAGESHTSGSGTDYSLSLNATSVPAPASLTIFGLGLVGLGYMRRRRKVV